MEVKEKYNKYSDKKKNLLVLLKSELLKKAKKQEKCKSYEEAEIAYRKYLTLHPSDTKVITRLGELRQLIVDRNYKKAMEKADNAIENGQLEDSLRYCGIAQGICPKKKEIANCRFNEKRMCRNY